MNSIKTLYSQIAQDISPALPLRQMPAEESRTAQGVRDLRRGVK